MNGNDAQVDSSQFLRLPRITIVSEEEFQKVYWPKLMGAIQMILQQNPGQFIPISYEEMYSTVYKCVCQQHSEKMYKGLLEAVSHHLEAIATDLQATAENDYLNKFQFAMEQYFQGVTGITAIFNYMNRFYVTSKEQTDLKTELLNLFTKLVANNNHLFVVLESQTSKPFGVDPQTVMSIIKGLYQLNPDFAQLNPHLFARFIPNLLPAAQLQDIDTLATETQKYQNDLILNQGFSREDRGNKRPGDEFNGDPHSHSMS